MKVIRRYKPLPLIIAVVIFIALSLLETEASSKWVDMSKTSFHRDVIVTDGDTIKAAFYAGRLETIRLWGIDAPELHQKCYKAKREIACGKEAKKALQKIVSGDYHITCEEKGIDRYKRRVSQCHTPDGEIGQMMVEQGWALDYPQYSKGYYKQSQEDAKNNKRGLWELSFDKPWNWRKGARTYK